jgi:hypothetical protein
MERYARKQVSTVNKAMSVGLPGVNKNKLDNEISRVALKILKKNQEHKSFDTGFGSSVSSTGTIQKLSTIPQGDTDSTRDGDALQIIRIEFRVAFAFADPVNTGRVIVARWNQDDSSAAPTGITDILQTATPYSPYNRDNLRAKKFSVIFDNTYLVGATGPNILGSCLSKNYPSKIAFQAAANTGNGHIYAFMVSDSAAIAHPIFTYVARIWFTDS